MRLRALCLCFMVLFGCRTVPELPPVDLSERGWRVLQGQAIWKPDRSAAELSGELIWAAHRDGRFLLQFSKTPITIVEARGSEEQWQVSFPAQGRTMSGSQKRPLPERLGWLYFARALQGEQPGGDWAVLHRNERWTLGNARTGEMIQGIFQP